MHRLRALLDGSGPRVKIAQCYAFNLYEVQVNTCLVLSRNPGKYFCNIVSFLLVIKWRSL